MERRVLGGRYELLEPVGGSSWHARDTELERDVLVRVGHQGQDPAVALSHPNVARVYDSGEADGEPYAVLEYLPGGSLADRGELDAAAAAEVAAALAYAHSVGLVHGSLTAGSILFDGEGRAKVVGFGGEGDPAADLAALDALVAEYGGTTAAPPPREPETEPTTLIQTPTTPIQTPPAAPRRRRGSALALIALTLAVAGVLAAFLAASDDSTADRPTGSLSIESPPSTAETEPEPPPPPPTTEQSTTEKTTTATTEPPPTTSAPLPTVTVPPVPTTAPPPTIEPPPTTEEPPPTTTEELPPTIPSG